MQGVIEMSAGMEHNSFLKATGQVVNLGASPREFPLGTDTGAAAEAKADGAPPSSNSDLEATMATMANSQETAESAHSEGLSSASPSCQAACGPASVAGGPGAAPVAGSAPPP